MSDQVEIGRTVMGSLGWAIKAALKRLPLSRQSPTDTRFAFKREPIETPDRDFRQIVNLLNFTKTSESQYSAQHFPAAYHTIDFNGRKLAGQRDPAKRLAQVPFDFEGKTVLDFGCNQGGMIFQIRDKIKWAVGVDYDYRMINAANKIKSSLDSPGVDFYVLDLQKDPLDLISDFLPDDRADVCFLLAVCMWLDNWREVIDFAQNKSKAMLFESNGSVAQQNDQIAYLKARYKNVRLLSETSDDDPGQKYRKLFFLTNED